MCIQENMPYYLVQVGTMSWGINCSEDSVPVFAKISSFRNWIDNEITNYNKI